MKIDADDLPQKSRTILLVDDEKEVARLLKRMIEKIGHTVVIANTAEEALDLLKVRHHMVDLMITDLNMPGMGGLELIKAIRQWKVDFEIIVITGFGTMETFIEAIRAGANDFVLKPIDREQFFHAINRSLEKRSLKENLVARTQQLVQSEKMASLGLLASGVAHEVNNPTTFIRTNLQLMGEYIKRMKPRFEAFDEPENREWVENLIFEEFPAMIDEAVKGTERIQKIVGGIKHYAHLGEDSFDADVDIREVIGQAVNLVRPKLRKNIEISENYLNTREIKGHFSKLEQVFVNLLVNAADAIADKIALSIAEGDRDYAGVIDVSATVIEGDDIDGVLTPDYLILSFYDNGGGIPEEKLARIFDPFFTTKPVGVGTGLGLYICYEIISQHGGEVTVQSDPGEGTAFIIKLPVRTPADGEEAMEQEPVEERRSGYDRRHEEERRHDDDRREPGERRRRNGRREGE